MFLRQRIDYQYTCSPFFRVEISFAPSPPSFSYKITFSSYLSNGMNNSPDSHHRYINSFGVLMTYVTVNESFYLTMLTYGLTFGIGIGIAYATPLSCCMRVSKSTGLEAKRVNKSLLRFALIDIV